MYCLGSSLCGAYLCPSSREGLTLCEFSLLFCHSPGLELLKNWCVKGYHTGAGTDLAQMVRMAVDELGRGGGLPG